MKKSSMVLILVLIVCMALSACKTKDKDRIDTSSINAASKNINSENKQNVSSDMKTEAGNPSITDIKFSYQSIYSPVLNGNDLYLSVSPKGRVNSDTNTLIHYDMKTKKETTIFKSPMKESNIQNIKCTDRWLTWLDLSLDGQTSVVYCKDLKNNKTEIVMQSQQNEAVVFSHILYGDSIFWIQEEQEQVNGVLKGYLMEYNCETKKSNRISKVNEIHLNNVFIAANDGKLVWIDILEGLGYYHTYDIKTHTIEKYKTKYKLPGYPQLYKDKIFSIDFNDSSDWTSRKFSFYNTTGSNYIATTIDADSIEVSGDYLAAKGASTYFYRIDGESLIQQTDEIEAVDFIYSCGNNIFTAIQQNADTGINKRTEYNIVKVIDFN